MRDELHFVLRCIGVLLGEKASEESSFKWIRRPKKRDGGGSMSWRVELPALLRLLEAQRLSHRRRPGAEWNTRGPGSSFQVRWSLTPARHKVTAFP